MEIRRSFIQPATEKGVPAVLQRPLDVIGSYGPVKRIEVPAKEVFILPSISVPQENLDTSQWTKKIPMGNNRVVYSVDELMSGENPRLVVKSGERRFTSRKENLDNGTVWWDGPRSNDKPVKIDSPVVEEKTAWEAAILTELWHKKIPAEVPQALIADNQGKVELVVQRIDESYGVKPDIPVEKLLDRVQDETELVPIDASNYNAIQDAGGHTHIIDVNRWRWPALTNDVDEKLIAEISHKIASK